jgi:hypothetical protein
MSMRSSNELALIISPSVSPTNNSTSTSPTFSGLPSSVSPFAVLALPPTPVSSPPSSLSSLSSSNSWDVVL